MVVARQECDARAFALAPELHAAKRQFSSRAHLELRHNALSKANSTT